MPSWCQLICLPKGYIIRLDIKGMQIGQIKQRIQEHFEQKEVENQQ